MYAHLGRSDVMIPKIMHQMWIGPRSAPLNLMNTWKEQHPTFEYILWSENEISKRKLQFECADKIEEIEDIIGKVDIMRWEILYKYGGIFIDADSICIRPLDEHIINCKAFATWENESVRPGLIAIGTMGFPPKHPLVKKIINRLKSRDVSYKKTGLRPWQVTGPQVLTEQYNQGTYDEFTIFPSHYFLPVHATGKIYKGDGVIYAYQVWGTTHGKYDSMNELCIESIQKQYNKEK